MKKVVCSVIAIILFSVLFGSCATLPPQQEELVEWSFVEHQFVLFEKEGNHTAAENFAREMMLEKWADWQVEALYYRLARSLYKQEKYKESLNLFRRLKDTKQFRPRVQLTAGEISLIMKRYDEALDWVLPVYLELKEEWKPGASRIIFLSYLYSRRIDNAAVWYSKLNEEKRAVLNEELNAWMIKNEKNKIDFENALTQTTDISVEEWSQELLEKAQKELELMEDIEEMDIIEDIPVSEMDVDPDFIPDPDQLCLMISEDEKWVKFNDVIESFVKWYFNEYQAQKINITTLKYSDSQSVKESFDKARELKCFAVAGPFFSHEFTIDFIESSISTSIPVISYNSFITNRRGHLFNVMRTKDIEAEEILRHVINELEISRIGLVYVKGKEGQILRDVYWKTVEKLGGQVTELMELGPGKKSYMDEVEKVVSMPENFENAVRSFRSNNKEKFANDTLLKRAVNRFVKTAPGKCEFDALVFLTPPNYLPMIIPSFPYKNVEFAYYQNYLKRNVRLKQQALDKEGYGWKIQQILLLPQSEIISNERVINQLGNYVDGMTIHAPKYDYSEENEAFSDINGKFSQKNERSMYAVENFIAETLNIIYQAREKALEENVSNIIDVLNDNSFNSLLTGKEVSFDEKNRLVGDSFVLIGRVKEPFMTKEMIEEQEKQRAEEREKARQLEKKSE
jgi:hypothetical protein